jgi:multiple sugar transport system substrate-binding protein
MTEARERPMVTINMWILWGGGLFSRDTIDREIGYFRKISPEINVEVTLIRWSGAWENILSAANEEKGPDILQIGSTWNATLAYLGVLKDISRECNEADISGDVFVPAAWSSCQVPGSGQISSVPWFVDIRSMYYREDIFKKLDMSGANLYDWTSLKEACQGIADFKAEGNLIDVLGVAGKQELLLVQSLAPWIWGAGGDFLTPDGKKAAFNSLEAVTGLEFYISLIAEGFIPLSALRVFNDQVYSNFFSQGLYATAIPGPVGDWDPLDPNSPTYVEEITPHCKPVLFPEGPAGRFVFCGGSNLAITSFSKHQQEAWEFIKFLLSHESQARYDRGNKFPSRLESFEAVFTDEKSRKDKFKESWKYGKSFPNIASWGAVESLLIECYGKIFARISEGDHDIFKVRTDLDKTALDVDSLLAR